MSRRSGILICLIAAVMILCGAASAEDGELFEYGLLDDGSVMITGYKGAETDLVFSEKIDGHTVSGLSGLFGVRTASIKGLRSITVPNTMTVIEPGALLFAEYLTEIRIAEDHPVLAFADGVLYNREKQSILLYLQSNKADRFDVPDGIREIEDRAFFRAGLVSVRIPGSVERIGRESFYQCYRLSEVTLSEGLKTIDTDAFTNSDKLSEIEIPASVTEIAEAAFTDCHLKAIRVAPGNPVFTISDGALINSRDGVLIAYPHFSEAESCVIPEGVTRIGCLAFYRAHNLKQITFPDGLLEIGHGAFLMCNHLTAIDLPDSVVKLEDEAFGTNSDTISLHLPAGLTEIVNNFDDLSITELEIPEGVIRIERSFTSLPKLTEVVIPGSVRTLGRNSFAFCKSLAGITIPAGVEEIGCTFIGSAEGFTVRVEPGSAADQYCREHQIQYEYAGE